MKTLFQASLCFAIFACCTLHATPTDKATINGKVYSRADSSVIIGAVVYFPDLKTGTVTDTSGKYYLTGLPQGTFTVQVSFIGYSSWSGKITLAENSHYDFYLDNDPTELREQVVTGYSSSADRDRSPTPIDVMSAQQLNQHAASNIIDAIAKMPGVSAVGTGPAISKPVIRGLGGNRVIVVNDGVRQEGQQWGDEHGIEIDDFSVDHVEILKGPASLTYGSDALAGVVNIISDPILPNGKIAGELKNSFQTNNGNIGSSFNMAGNRKNFIWNLRYTHEQAHDYMNRYDGPVFNSRFRQNSFSITTGMNGTWGFSHLSFSSYHLQTGIVEGTRDSTTGKFTKEIFLGGTIIDSIATDDDLRSYQMTTPHQDIQHYKVTSNSSFVAGNALLKTTFAFQQNQRREFTNPEFPSQYGLFLLLNTLSYDVRCLFPEYSHVQFVMGLNGMYQRSGNKGVEFLVPGHSLLDAGVFLTAERSWKHLTVSGGARFDLRDEHGTELYLDSSGNVSTPGNTSILKFPSFHSTFNGISVSAGISYKTGNGIFFRANTARGYRAPNIAELASNGVHEGALRYMIGDPSLTPELSTQFDIGGGISSAHVTAELAAFSNSIQHYIYARKLLSVNNSDSLLEGKVVMKYSSGLAQLSGGEFSIDIHPHPFDWLHFENSFSLVLATQKNVPDSMRYLPFIPAPVTRSELRADVPKSFLSISNIYIMIEMEHFFGQDRFYGAFGTETATPAYTLFNAGIGGDVMNREKKLCSFNIYAANLSDVAFQDHLSRLKYAGANNTTGRVGVFNMGRNFMFRLNIPIVYHE